MVNVLHHVQNITPVLKMAMESVQPGGHLIIKDHFVDDGNILLATLVHVLKDGDSSIDNPPRLYFRSLEVIITYLRNNGWVVKTHKLAWSYVGDVILVCTNYSGAVDQRVSELEQKVSDLTELVKTLSVRGQRKVFNEDYRVEELRHPKKRHVIDRHDLAAEIKPTLKRIYPTKANKIPPYKKRVSQRDKGANGQQVIEENNSHDQDKVLQGQVKSKQRKKVPVAHIYREQPVEKKEKIPVQVGGSGTVDRRVKSLVEREVVTTSLRPPRKYQVVDQTNKQQGESIDKIVVEERGCPVGEGKPRVKYRIKEPDC